ncbi:TetR/AcrR family transcriptional regulator [Pseudomonas putida]|nr:TetR/AcrR family transcriptional regulator [Pseudomonas putida]
MTRQLRWGDASRMDSAEQGRQQILECALAAMIELGPDGFAIDDVARRANISRRTLYRYFATKHELVQAVISSENAAFFSAMQQQLSAFEDNFERYLEECLCFAVRYRDQHRGGFHQGYLAKAATPEVFAYILEDIAPLWQQVLAGPFEACAARHGGAANLTDCVALVSRLCLAYCLVPAEEAQIRNQVRLLLHLAA